MVVVFAVALIAHLLVFVQYRSDPFTQTLVSDALSYHEWARRIADHGLAPEPVFHQAPLFPLLLAAIYRLGFPHGAIVAQMVSSSLAIALLVPLARLYLRSVSAGVVAGALGILHAPFVFHGMKLLPIPLTLLTQAMAIVLVGLARRSGRAWQVVLAGIGCGFACLARTEFLLFIPVAILALVFPVRDAAPRRWGLTTLLLCSGIALVLAPVTLHNFSRGDHVLVSASAGENLYIGNQRGADGGHTPLHDQAGDLFSQRALAEIVAEEQLGRQARPSEISSYWLSIRRDGSCSKRRNCGASCIPVIPPTCTRCHSSVEST
jgi:hypothetical protein